MGEALDSRFLITPNLNYYNGKQNKRAVVIVLKETQPIKVYQEKLLIYKKMILTNLKLKIYLLSISLIVLIVPIFPNRLLKEKISLSIKSHQIKIV